MGTRWLPAVLLVALSGSQATKILHATEDRVYDDSWRPLNITSKAQLEALLQAEYPQSKDDHSRKHWLIALVADHGHPGDDELCGDSYRDEHLRSAHRKWPPRFLKLGHILLSALEGGFDEWREIVGELDPKKQTTSDEIRDKTCAAVLVAPGELWSQGRVFKLPDWQFGYRREMLNVIDKHSSMPGVTAWNNRSEPVSISFYHAEGESSKRHKAQVLKTIQPGGFFLTNTYIGHTFVVEKAHNGTALEDSENIIGFFAISRKQETFYITDGMLHSCARSLGEGIVDGHVRKRISDPDFDDADVGRLLLQEMVFGINLEKRIALSDVQIKSVPNFTKEGFKKMRVPEGSFEELRSWYVANFDEQKVEHDGGPLYNHRHIPSFHTPIPSGMKRKLFLELKRIMEDWVDGMALEGTSLYGVRTYVNGSYLHLHVDTAETHVISGIINVDQDVNEPWPLEIFDLEGKLHAVNMDPGDLLLYESARLLHGRPHALNGRHYANLFVHYKPKEDYSVKIL